jgi:hypothetical protein
MTTTNNTTNTYPTYEVATDRAEDDYCQCGTHGCCVDHKPGTNYVCQTW